MQTTANVTVLGIVAAALAAWASADPPGLGGGDDYWIEQQVFTDPGKWTKVALVFGYGNDRWNGIMCNDFVEAMTVKVSDAPAPAKFRCMAAK